MNDVDGLIFRRPMAPDHARVVSVLDEWWGGRRMRNVLPRFWFEHFAGSSWIVEDPGGRLVGFLVGFRSADQPDEAYVHLAGTGPNRRRRGIARALYARFSADMTAAGVQRIRTVTWPGDRGSVAFHRAIGFVSDDGPGTQRLYGTPAVPDHDGEGEDRVVLTWWRGSSPA